MSDDKSEKKDETKAEEKAADEKPQSKPKEAEVKDKPSFFLVKQFCHEGAHSLKAHFFCS